MREEITHDQKKERQKLSQEIWWVFPPPPYKQKNTVIANKL